MAVITEEYRAVQQEAHQDPNYGVASVQFAPIVKRVMETFGVRSISDYGAGKQRLRTTLESLGVHLDGYWPYDPAFPEYGPARTADLLCCIDVLEHIEPDCLDSVLDELQRLTTRLGVFTVHTTPAERVLSDGRNAHLIVEPESWWLPKIEARWKLAAPVLRAPDGSGFLVVVKPRA